MSNLPPLAWIEEAKTMLGKKEVTENNAPFIKAMQKGLGWEWLGNVPWCGVFVAHCLKKADLHYPTDGYRAKSYKTLVKKLDQPCIGCIVVFDREGGGHVGFIVGQTQDGRLMVLGGNQGNKVSIAPFSRTRKIEGYYWPSRSPHPDRYNLPIIHSNLSDSTNEH